MIQKKFKNQIKDWLDSSPTVTLIVVLAAIIGFLFSTINGGYTILKEIKEQQLSPKLVILGLTGINQKRKLNTNRFLGIRTQTSVDAHLEENSYNFDPKSTWEIPFYPATILVTNPLNRPLTILDIRLVIDFIGGGRHVSHAYILAVAEKNVISFSSPIYLNPHEAKRIELDFLFIPVPAFIKQWEQSYTKKEFEAFIVWDDDTGRRYSTPIKLFSKGDLGYSDTFEIAPWRWSIL